MIDSTPRVITGVYRFQGGGYDKPTRLVGEGAGPSYTVPADKRAQLIYFRAGNSSGEMIALALLRDGRTMRVFPVGAKAAEHVPLAVVEDLMPETRLDVLLAAPEGASGTVVLDMGLVEI
jgi:hypothetical protein